MEWYFTQGTEREGPVSEAEFLAMIAAGVIRDDTFVWNESLSDWMPYVELRLDGPPSPQPPPVPPTAAHTKSSKSPPTTMQRIFFLLVLVLTGFAVLTELWFRFSPDPATTWSDFALVQRASYWITLVIGAIALWEQGRRPARNLRFCVVVPFALMLIMPMMFTTLIRFITSEALIGSGGFLFLRALGYGTRAIDAGCAIYGLVLIGRVRASN